MSDPYGGPFAPWDSASTYSTGDRVSLGGYIYQAMTSISAGDDPRTATFTATATNKIGPGTSTRTARKWRIWDYPVGYYMARLRGLPEFELDGPEEVRTFCVRGEFDNRAEVFTYPTYASYAFYDMPAGMDTVWPAPASGELLIMPSAVPLEDSTRPAAYPSDSGSSDDAVSFQPNTVSAQITSVEVSPGTFEDALLPAWSSDTQGQMFACMATFSRTYKYNLASDPTGEGNAATNLFEDNWTANPYLTGTDDVGTIIDSSPDFVTGDAV